MISWIQRTFQHHFKSIFGFLLVITIISFVFIYSPSSGFRNADRALSQQQYFDLNVATSAGSQTLLSDALISINLQLGSTLGISNEQLQQYALNRYAAIYLANQLHIPNPTEAELADQLRELPLFFNEAGVFDPAVYADFRNSLKLPTATVTEGELRRVLNADWRAGAVQRLLGGPGYVQSNEVATELQYADTVWTASIATLDYESYKPPVTTSNDELQAWFDDNSYRYEIAPQQRVSYLSFPTANYLNAVTLTDAEVRAAYNANPSQFPAPTAGDEPAVLDLASGDAYQSVRPQVEAALREEYARQLALSAASDVAVALFNSQATPGPALDQFLASRNLTLTPLAPFTEAAGPAELGGSTAVAAAAFQLNATRFFSDAIAVPSGGAVLIWQESIPTRVPLFAEVRNQVLEDYVENERRLQFIDKGHTFAADLKGRIAAGAAFADAVAAAAAAVELTASSEEPEPFSLRNLPDDLPSTVINAVYLMEKGDTSDLALAETEAYVVHVRDKALPDLSPDNPAYAEAREQLAASMASFNSDAYLSEIVTQELNRTVIDTTGVTP